MADDKQERIETLQDRVDELEATVSKMLPSRRDALKLGAAGAVGAVGMAGSASAQNSGQTGTIGTDADRVDVNAEDIDAVSVNTASILGDSTVVGEQTRQTDTSIITADTYQTAYDNTSFEEPSGHFSGGVFNPPRDGYYVFFGRVEFRGNTVADDVVRVRWRNTTDSTNVARTGQQRAPSSFYVFQTFLSSQLSANDSYEIQATNRSSDFTIDNSNTYCTIFRIR